MIVILQFDAVNLPIFHELQQQGQLRSLFNLRRRGHWYNLETPAARFEGATYFSLYSGTHAGDHCVYFPFMWSAPDQRVRKYTDFPARPILSQMGSGGAGKRRAIAVQTLVGMAALTRPMELVRLLFARSLCDWLRARMAWSIPGSRCERLVLSSMLLGDSTMISRNQCPAMWPALSVTHTRSKYSLRISSATASAARRGESIRTFCICNRFE
jgi:hypothetical protein